MFLTVHDHTDTERHSDPGSGDHRMSNPVITERERERDPVIIDRVFQ